MAFRPYYPLKKPISFELQKQRTLIEFEANQFSKNDYFNVQNQFWEKLADTRQRTAEARKKFSELSTTELVKKWENWDEATIDGFRIQFQIIDLNEDGLIDFNELCKVLDEIGDSSALEERRAYFDEVDIDQSEGVDFEEFLELMDQVETGKVRPDKGWGAVLLNKVQTGEMGDGNTIGKMCNTTSMETKTIMRIRQYNLKQLLQLGLF